MRVIIISECLQFLVACHFDFEVSGEAKKEIVERDLM